MELLLYVVCTFLLLNASNVRKFFRLVKQIQTGGKLIPMAKINDKGRSQSWPVLDDMMTWESLNETVGFYGVEAKSESQERKLRKGRTRTEIKRDDRLERYLVHVQNTPALHRFFCQFMH